MEWTISSLIGATDAGDSAAADALFSTLYSELHRMAKREIGRWGAPVSLNVTPNEARRELLRIGPLPAVNMLLDDWAAAIGQPAHVTSTVAEITGRPARTLVDWATDNAAESPA